jgi:single-strand DNA-binding protein
MALSMNKVILIGNVGQDPDVRTIPSGARVCKISVATTENYKDKSGEWVDSTEWHRVVLWDYLADRAEKYLKRGSKVCIEGKNKTTKYEKDGVTHYTTEVIARDLILLDPKNRDGGGVSDSGSSYSATSPKTTPESDDTGDDDIPF